MIVKYRIDGKDFDTLDQALDYVSDTYFSGLTLDYEKSSEREGYSYEVFIAGEYDEDTAQTIYEIRDV